MMHFPSSSPALLLLISSLTSPVHSQSPTTEVLVPETPCPLLGADFPAPTDIASSSLVQAALKNLTGLLESAISTGDSTHGPIPLNTTSFSMSIFSLDDPSNSTRIFEFHQTSPTLANVTNGTHKVDANSIYRIGSVSKIFTSYTYLIELGFTHWFDPVTKWVPELAATAKANNDTVNFVQWEDVTLADLLSHMSGIGKENSDFDFALHFTPEQAEEAGFPALNGSEIPSCGVDPFCDRAGFFETFTQRPPVFLPATTPIYSDVSYQIFTYAFEAITGKSFQTMLTDGVITPLGLNATSLGTNGPPNSSSLGVIPKNDTISFWNVATGDESPTGGFYTSLNDLEKLSISILSSTVLPPTTTRRWLKPVTHTSNLLNSVGAPWEISRALTSPNNRVVDYYTKSGNLGFYTAIIALSVDYNIGFEILAAGEDTSLVNSVSMLADFVGDTLLPQLETVAQQQAISDFVGLYESIGNNSLVLGYDGLPGLSINAWISNSTDLLEAFAMLAGVPSVQLRLFPTNLVATSTNGTTRVAWRMLPTETSTDTGVFSLACTSWSNVDYPIYGGKGADEFIFTVQSDGVAQSVTLPAFREVLGKSSS